MTRHALPEGYEVPCLVNRPTCRIGSRTRTVPHSLLLVSPLAPAKTCESWDFSPTPKGGSWAVLAAPQPRGPLHLGGLAR